MAYVYILQSQETGEYYVGSTADLSGRMAHHLGGYTPSTSRMGTLKLVFRQKFDKFQDARGIVKKTEEIKKERLYRENSKRRTHYHAPVAQSG